MHSNAVVEDLKIRHNLLQLRTTSDFNLANGAFEGAKESLNSAILPELMRRTALMFDAQLVHRQREIDRHKSAIIFGSKHFWFAEFVDQIAQRLNEFCRTFIGKFKCQKLSTAVVDHTKQRMRLLFDTDICPIQCSGLIWFAMFRRFPKLLAQLQNGVAIVFAKLGNKAFAYRFLTIGKAGIELCYDSVKRLKQESVSGSASQGRSSAWTYDAVGNRLTDYTTGNIYKYVTYAYDNNDRLTRETEC